MFKAVYDHAHQRIAHAHTAVVHITQVVLGLQCAGEDAVVGKVQVFGPDCGVHLSGARTMIGDALPAHRGENNGAVPHLALEEIHLAEKVRDELIGRRIVDLLRAAALLHNAAVDEKDAVAHGHGLGLVMGHVHHRDAEFFLNLLDLKAHGLAELRVEI